MSDNAALRVVLGHSESEEMARLRREVERLNALLSEVAGRVDDAREAAISTLNSQNRSANYRYHRLAVINNMLVDAWYVASETPVPGTSSEDGSADDGTVDSIETD